MPWGRIDDSLYDHPKLDALGSSRLPCVGLNALALSWSNRFLTDGFIPVDRVRRLGGTVILADKLVNAGLWERAGDDYRIHDFLDFNDSAADVRNKREEMRAKGKRGGIASAAARRSNRDASNDSVEPHARAPVGTGRVWLGRDADAARAREGEAWEDAEGEALTWLARHGCDIRPGNGYHQKLILAVENHGINAVIGMFDRLETAGVKHGDIKGYLFGAIDALNGRPDLKGLEAGERAEERNTNLQRSIAATKRRTAELEEWRERPEPERQAQT